MGKPRLSPTGSGHLRAARATTIRHPTTLPATLPPSPPLLPPLSTTPPAFLPFLPFPLRECFGIPTRSSKAHLRCAGLVWFFLSTHVGNGSRSVIRVFYRMRLEGLKMPKKNKLLESRSFEEKKRAAWGDLWGVSGPFRLCRFSRCLLGGRG